MLSQSIEHGSGDRPGSLGSARGCGCTGFGEDRPLIEMAGDVRKIGRESVNFILAGLRGFLRPYSPRYRALES
jgi:hypothetical protein